MKRMVGRGTNGVTSGNLLDRRVRQADIAAMASSAERVPFRIILSVATALGFFSAFAAFYFVSTFTDKPATFGGSKIATGEDARRILARIQKESEPFGTQIRVEGDIGVIRIPR